MGIICTIFLFALLIISLAGQKLNCGNIKLKSIFLALWFLISLFSNFRFEGLYPISNDAYILVIVGCLSYLIGYSLKKTRLIYNNHSYQTTIFSPIFRFHYYIVLIFAIFVVVKQIELLLPIIIANGMSEARGGMGDPDMILTGFWPVLLAYFAKPFLMASLIVILLQFFRKSFSWQKLCLLLLLCVVYFFSEGGRLFLMDLMFCLIYIAYTHKNLIDNKRKKYVIWGIAFFALASIFATLQRGSDILGNLNFYYCGSLGYLGNFLNSPDADSSNFLYGLTSYQGFLSPIYGLLGIIGIDKPEALKNATEFIMTCQHTTYQISPDVSINYYASCFGYAYHDGGIIAVIFVLMFYGFMCAYIDQKEVTHPYDTFWLSIKCVFVYTSLFTMAIFPFAKYLYPMTMFYIWVILKFLTYKKEI